MARSPELLDRSSCGVLIVDVQSKLIDLIEDRDRIVARCVRLVAGAAVFGIPVFATEQYPKGLGPTVPELADRIPQRPEKLAFSCCGASGLVEGIQARGIRSILLAGIESHVCVLQTAMDLLACEMSVFVSVDAVGSRHEIDRTVGLRRMERAGVRLLTSESALFEWTEESGTPEFKQIIQLVKLDDSGLLNLERQAVECHRKG